MTDEAPKRIWLQLHGDEPPEAWNGPVDFRSGEVTWCWEPIFEYDIEYVRADLADARERELVESAYREGHFTGRCGAAMFDENDDWSNSKSYAATVVTSKEQDDE